MLGQGFKRLIDVTAILGAGLDNLPTFISQRLDPLRFDSPIVAQVGFVDDQYNRDLSHFVKELVFEFKDDVQRLGAGSVGHQHTPAEPRR